MEWNSSNGSSSDEKDPMLCDSPSSGSNNKQSYQDQSNQGNQSNQSSQLRRRSKRTKKSDNSTSTSTSSYNTIQTYRGSKSNKISNASPTTTGAKSVQYQMLSKIDATSDLKLNWAVGRSALNEFSTLEHLLGVPVKVAITNVGNHIRQQLARRPKNNFTESEISKTFWNQTKMSLQDFLCNKPWDENTFDTAVCVVLKGLGY